MESRLEVEMIFHILTNEIMYNKNKEAIYFYNIRKCKLSLILHAAT